MPLLKHGNYEFKNILEGGYNIIENEPKIESEVIMADGTIKRNYGQMPKTSISIKFGRLDKDTYIEYMSHFSQNEDTYSYFSPRNQTMLTKKFFVNFPENSILDIDNSEQIYDEFEIQLTQCGEVWYD